MSGQIATPPATTIVRVSGKLPDGRVVEQDFPVTHPTGAPGPQIVAAAYQMFKNLGGFLKDTPGYGLEFYMASKFDAPFTFEIKNVVLVPSIIS